MKTWKRIPVSILLILTLGIFSCEDPNGPGSEFTLTVTGKIVRLLNPSGIDSVVITLQKPFKRDTSSFDGAFEITGLSKEDNDITTTVTLSHLGLAYFDTTYEVVYSRTKNSIDLGEIKMRGRSSSLDSQVTGRPSFRPKVLTFVRSTFPLISIKGAGNDITSLTFEVRDSVGNPVDANNKALVRFKVISSPDAEVALNRSSVVTNTIGQVVVQLSAGKRAGIAQVQAVYIDTVRADTVKSPIVSVTIAGGLPVASRFSIGSSKTNVPGLVKYNMRNTITAMVGDTFGNPVQQGTVVYFETTGGIIQPYSTTNADGTLSTDLITANPAPDSGIAIIKATVGTPGSPSAAPRLGKNAVDKTVLIKGLRKNLRSAKQDAADAPAAPVASASTIVRTLAVLFTGAPIIRSVDSSFIVPPLGAKQIQFTVADLNGNPMSQGTSIKVTGVGLDTVGAELTGDLLSVLPDTYDRSYTRYTVLLRDKRTKNLSSNIPIGITVEVTGDNGNIKRTFNGFLTSALSDSGKVGSISIVNSGIDSLVAVGAGSPNSVTIQARVLTASGLPSVGIPVNFSIVRSVDGGEYLSTSSGFTNGSGIASSTLFSGIRSGLVQVQTSVRKDSFSVSSDIKSIYIKTGKVISLSLVSSSATSLSVKGGGGTENTVLIFEAKDSLGNTVDGSNPTDVQLSIQGDTAGARINPSVTKTDPNTGRITTMLTAGVQAGIIQVTAKSGTISSSPVQIAVAGGLPSQSQFTLTVPKKNFSTLTDKVATVAIIAGDSYGNPAKAGTLINFKTNGGLIDATSVTNGSGGATANLQIVNPQPPSGIATIEAKTFGAGGVLVRDTQTVVFSGEAVIAEIGGPFANFEIEDGLSRTFQFRVADANGNPIAGGNLISVEAFGNGSSNVKLTGDINVLTQDTKVPGIGRTQFSFTARDSVKDEGQGPKVLGFTIRVNGPNTNGLMEHTVTGTLKGGAGVGNEGSVASVSHRRSSNDTIFVANAGSPTSDTLIFRVLNLNQLPVKNAAVQFFFNQSLNASEFVSPSFAVSDDSGDVRVVVHSGIKAGVLKVEARVTAGASTIISLPVTVYVKTGPLHSIALIGVERNELSVKGVGGEENATVTYEARDLLGNALDFANQTKLFFSFVGVAGSDEEVNPDSAITNPFTGRASVNVTSGTRSTVLQVVARNASNTVRSSPVPIIVHGGFVVDSLFTFTNIVRNISSKEKTPVTIAMSLGDRYGNPVKPGTAVYFESSVGIIKASAFTDNNGIVTTTVTPSENLGLRKIVASTVGESGGSVNVLLKKELPILMSGVPVITVPSDTITLFDGGETTVNFKIADASNNPISDGHLVSTSLSGSVANEIGLRGDQSFVTRDVTDTSQTNYSLIVRDNFSLSGTGGTFGVTITVNGTTGIYSKTFYGKLYSPNNIVVPPSAREPAQIAFISSTATDLSVAGVGALENALLTYEVRDSLGVPIDRNKRTVATYSMQFFPNSFVGGGTAPKVIPTIDSTDDQGKLRVSVVSGTQAGNMQIVVRIQVGVNVITSQPVKITIHAGFPDQAHFTVTPGRRSFLGHNLFNEIPFTVSVGDTFSNPVATGTAIYFHSQAGIIQTGSSNFGAYTNTSGRASVNLLTVNPTPSAAPYSYLPSSGAYAALINNRPGYHWVYAQTQGRNGKNVIDSVLVLQCISPITPTGIPNATVTLAAGGSSADIPITIKDGNGNPLPEGTVITVSLTYDAGVAFSVSGGLSSGASTTLSSGSLFPGAGTTDFTIRVNDLTSGGAPVNTSVTVTITATTLQTSAGTFLSRTMSFNARVQ